MAPCAHCDQLSELNPICCDQLNGGRWWFSSRKQVASRVPEVADAPGSLYFGRLALASSNNWETVWMAVTNGSLESSRKMELRRRRGDNTARTHGLLFPSQPPFSLFSSGTDARVDHCTGLKEVVHGVRGTKLVGSTGRSRTLVSSVATSRVEANRKEHRHLSNGPWEKRPTLNLDERLKSKDRAHRGFFPVPTSFLPFCFDRDNTALVPASSRVSGGQYFSNKFFYSPP
ncbi:hypothetical protein HU200_038303 [Digitaria exilis]|uniref:Uncharacterized protein n=1 Tax=Digitaria exilis TaxID=1010633 RepID=A0A835BD30_9POAL|nr:hypothetical protein HU200_038303 [Digitaria exilis]